MSSQAEARFKPNKSKKKHNDDKKKPFDKKKYRDQKYNIKHKLDAWKEQKKKRALKKLYSEMEQTDNKFRMKPFNRNNSKSHPNQGETPKASSKKIQKEQEPVKSREEIERAEFEAEMNKSIKEFKEKKAEVYKKKRMFTKKGQPIMQHRIELMLDKIKMNVAADSRFTK